MTDLEFHWLAGLLEGEGSFQKGPPSEPNRPRISLMMTDEEIVRRAAAITGLGYLHCRKDKRNKKWKPYFYLSMRGYFAGELMKKLRPLMGTRRQAQIDVALASYTPRRAGDNTRKLTPRHVKRIRELLKGKNPVAWVARQYGVSRTTIRRIGENKLWAPRG
jgi:hypothetical protein